MFFVPAFSTPSVHRSAASSRTHHRPPHHPSRLPLRPRTPSTSLPAPLRCSASSAAPSSSTSAGASSVVYGGIQHVGILVSDLPNSLEFYLNTLGMQDDTQLRNPKLPFAGAFVRAGNTQIHLMVGNTGGVPLPSFSSGRPEHGGRDYHVALAVNALAPIREALTARGISYTMSKSGRAALFCRDPDGNALEFMETPALAERPA